MWRCKEEVGSLSRLVLVFVSPSCKLLLPNAPLPSGPLLCSVPLPHEALRCWEGMVRVWGCERGSAVCGRVCGVVPAFSVS